MISLYDSIDTFFSSLPLYPEARQYFEDNLIADVWVIKESSEVQTRPRIVDLLHHVVARFRDHIDPLFAPAIPDANDISLKDIESIVPPVSLTWLRNPGWLDAIEYVTKSRPHIPNTFSSEFHNYINDVTAGDTTEVPGNPFPLVVRHFYRTTLIDSFCLTSDLNHALWVLAQSGDINAFTIEVNEALSPLSAIVPQFSAFRKKRSNGFCGGQTRRRHNDRSTTRRAIGLAKISDRRQRLQNIDQRSLFK